MTAVISKTNHEFQKWCLKNPRYPDPVMVQSVNDIMGKQFFFVKNTAEAPKMPNFRRLFAYCESRVILVVAIVTKDMIDMRKYPEHYYRHISTMEEALKYRYSKVIVGKSAKRLKDWQDIVELCQSRLYSE